MRKNQSVDEPTEQRDRRRNQAARRKDHARTKQHLIHAQSLACHGSTVQEQLARICASGHKASTLEQSQARGENVWYTSFALNTAVVLCGPSGSLFEIPALSLLRSFSA